MMQEITRITDTVKSKPQTKTDCYPILGWNKNGNAEHGLKKIQEKIHKMNLHSKNCKQ